MSIEMPIEMSFVETTYGRFHLEAAGRGEPILLIHGGTASAREWRPVIGGLGKHARCIAPDRLGCGLSDRSPRYDRETITNSFFALADALGWDRFSVVGQSYGGFWSLSMAFAHPTRISRMVLVNSAGGPMSEGEIAKLQARRAARPSPPATAAEREAALDRTINTIFADTSRIPATFRDDLRWQSERADPAQLQHTGEHFAQLARERYNTIRIPTLVVWGEADALIPTERGKRLAEAIPGAQYVGLPGIGHTCQIEAPTAFIDAVVPFLDATAGR